MNAATPIDVGLDPAPWGLGLQLWCVDLDRSDLPLEGLPAAVRQRAARFVREADRRRYLASQAALRSLVGDRGAWREGERGKPALADGGLHFNASRRDGWGAVALSPTHEVGVDIETLREIEDAAELAALHFTARERAQAGDAHAFLRVWTRKEACMKATGLGLWLPPSSFECGAQAAPQRVQVHHAGRDWALLVHTPRVAAPVALSWAVVLP